MIENIAIEKLVPHPQNPRKELGDLTELRDSIKTNGAVLLQAGALFVTATKNLQGAVQMKILIFYPPDISLNRRIKADVNLTMDNIECIIGSKNIDIIKTDDACCFRAVTEDFNNLGTNNIRFGIKEINGKRVITRSDFAPAKMKIRGICLMANWNAQKKCPEGLRKSQINRLMKVVHSLEG